MNTGASPSHLAIIALAIFLASTSVVRAQSLPEITRMAVPAPASSTGSITLPFSVPDIDGDGLADLVLPRLDGVWDFRGSRSGALLYSVTTPGTTSDVVAGMTPTDDLDGDGISELALIDFILVASANLPSKLRVVRGADGSDLWETPLLLSATPTSLPQPDLHVEPIGDQNGDGVTDLLLRVTIVQSAAFPSASNPVTWIEIRSGGDGSLIHQISASGDDVARRVEVLGDLDGDGIDEFAMGAHLADVTGENSGAVVIIRGGTFEYLRVRAGVREEQRFGYSVVRVGDVDEDGCDDYGVISAGRDTSAPFAPGFSGLYEVYSGATDARLVRREMQSDTPFFSYFHRELPIVDMNGDGIGDPVLDLVLPLFRRLIDGATGEEMADFTSRVGVVEDFNGDGIGDIAEFFPADTTGALTDEIVVTTLLGAQAYGTGTGAPRLRWAPHPATPQRGSVVLEQGAPFASAIIGASLASATGPGGLLIDLDPTLLYGTMMAPLDATGRFAAALDLRVAGLAGTVVYVQALDPTDGSFTNGLELLFGS